MVTTARSRSGDKFAPARTYSPMYLPANWFVSLVRRIQEIAVVHRRRRRSPRRPRAALRFANQHFRPTILERAARASFSDSSALHWLLSSRRSLCLHELTHRTPEFIALYFIYGLGDEFATDFSLSLFGHLVTFLISLQLKLLQKCRASLC